MYGPRWELAGFETLDTPTKCRLMFEMVCCLAEMNLEELPRLGLPALYQSGVRYGWQDPDQDSWKDCAEVFETGEGSCNSLVAWRVAELILQGVECGPWIQTDVQQTSRGPLEVYHCVLWKGVSPQVVPIGQGYGRRRWECPSRILGMPAEAPPE